MDGENITDILLQNADVGNQDPFEPGSPEYNQELENRARNQAAEILRKNQVKQSTSEVMGAAKQINELKSVYDKTIAELKNEIAELKGGFKSTSATVDSLSNKYLTDNIIAEEQNLAKDEVIAPYFDQTKVRNTFLANLKGDPQKGIAPKELTPYEAWAIANSYDLAKENAMLKSKIQKRQSLQNLSFEDIQPYGGVDRSPKVNDSRSAKQAALDYARELDGN